MLFKGNLGVSSHSQDKERVGACRSTGCEETVESLLFISASIRTSRTSFFFACCTGRVGVAGDSASAGFNGMS